MDTVLCPSCGEENPSRFRLCGFCGTPLSGGATAAPATPVSPAARLVAQAGTVPFGEPAAPVFGVPAPAPAPALPSAEVRKPATFIFVDLKGSTALTERIDQEAMSEIKRTYFTAMAAQVERHGGTIEKYIGDAIMAVFGIPKAREDDALRAVRAAYGMQQELVRLNAEFLPFYGVELANRTGVNTGEVVANIDPTANQQLATGDTVNVAARLEQAAPPNEILIGETTWDLVRAHVDVEAVEPLELKGKAERVPAFRLLAVRDATAEGAHLARRAPLIGREAVMDQVRGVLAEAIESGGARQVTLVGEAGVGKSRLLDDIGDEVADSTTVVRGRCLPYGDGITFWPIVEVVRDAAHIAADDTPDVARGRIADLLAGSGERDEILDRVSSVIGLSASRYPVPEIFWAARKFLEVMAAGRPVLLLFEDIHYAEPTFLDLVDHLVETLPDHVSALILCAGRLPLLDKRPDWATQDRTTRLVLPALDDADTGRLVEALLGAPVDAEVRMRVVHATDGNPLFTEQLVSMLVDKGHIRRSEDGWVPVRDVSALAVPPTIQALLAARLDDLSREERATIEPAAVIGFVFAQAAVAELVPATIRPSVPTHLAALDRKQLLQREVAAESEDDAYRFRNLLIRDATYGSLLKRARAQMHERFVTWAERVNRERGREEEFEEILGYHLEQAYRYRTELGPIDAEGRAIALRAAEKLGNAGRRAFSRSDLPAASSLLGRAVALLPESDARRIELAADLGESLVGQGRFEEAMTVLAAAAQVAGTFDDPRLVARVAVIELLLNVYASSGSVSASGIIERATALVGVLEAAGDDAGLARAWRLVMANRFTLGQLSGAAEAADRVVTHATAADDRRLAGRSAPAIAYILVHGPTPVPEAIERCEELLGRIRGDRMNEAIVISALAQLRAMAGEFEAARQLYRQGQAILRELGGGINALSTSIDSSRVELRAGAVDEAIRELRRDDDALAAIDETYFRSTVTAILANALCLDGRFDEALDCSMLAERLSDADDVWSQVSWRTARAHVMAARDEAEQATAIIREAVALVGSTEDIELQAETLVESARVMRALGRHDEAGPPFREALRLFELKGDVAAAEQVRRGLEALATA